MKTLLVIITSFPASFPVSVGFSLRFSADRGSFEVEGVQTTYPSSPSKTFMCYNFLYFYYTCNQLQLIVVTYPVVYKPVNSDSSSKFMVALTGVTMIIQPSTVT